MHEHCSAITDRIVIDDFARRDDAGAAVASTDHADPVVAVVADVGLVLDLQPGTVAGRGDVGYRVAVCVVLVDIRSARHAIHAFGHLGDLAVGFVRVNLDAGAAVPTRGQIGRIGLAGRHPVAGDTGQQAGVGIVGVAGLRTAEVRVRLDPPEVIDVPALAIAVGGGVADLVAVDVVGERLGPAVGVLDRGLAADHPVLAVVVVIRRIAQRVGDPDAVAMAVERVGLLRLLGSFGAIAIQQKVALGGDLAAGVVGGVGDVSHRAGRRVDRRGLLRHRAAKCIVGGVSECACCILGRGEVAGVVIGVPCGMAVLVGHAHQLAGDVVVPGLGGRGPGAHAAVGHHQHPGLDLADQVVLAVVGGGGGIAVGIRGGGDVVPAVVGVDHRIGALTGGGRGAGRGFRDDAAGQVAKIGGPDIAARPLVTVASQASGKVVTEVVHDTGLGIGLIDQVAAVVVGVGRLVALLVALGHDFAEGVVLHLGVAVVTALAGTLHGGAQLLVVGVVAIRRGDRAGGAVGGQRIALGQHVAVVVVGAGGHHPHGIRAGQLVAARIVGGLRGLRQATGRGGGAQCVAQRVVDVGRHRTDCGVQLAAGEVIPRGVLKFRLPVGHQRQARRCGDTGHPAGSVVGRARGGAVDGDTEQAILAIVGVAGDAAGCGGTGSAVELAQRAAGIGDGAGVRFGDLAADQVVVESAAAVAAAGGGRRRGQGRGRRSGDRAGADRLRILHRAGDLAERVVAGGGHVPLWSGVLPGGHDRHHRAVEVVVVGVGGGPDRWRGGATHGQRPLDQGGAAGGVAIGVVGVAGGRRPGCPGASQRSHGQRIADGRLDDLDFLVALVVGGGERAVAAGGRQALLDLRQTQRLAGTPTGNGRRVQRSGVTGERRDVAVGVVRGAGDVAIGIDGISHLAVGVVGLVLVVAVGILVDHGLAQGVVGDLGGDTAGVRRRDLVADGVIGVGGRARPCRRADGAAGPLADRSNVAYAVILVLGVEVDAALAADGDRRRLHQDLAPARIVGGRGEVAVAVGLGQRQAGGVVGIGGIDTQRIARRQHATGGVVGGGADMGAVGASGVHGGGQARDGEYAG